MKMILLNVLGKATEPLKNSYNDKNGQELRKRIKGRLGETCGGILHLNRCSRARFGSTYTKQMFS